MKLQFDKNLEYQHQAIASIVDLFRGQTPMQTNFTVAPYNGQIGLYDSTNGIGNRLELDEDEILENLQAIQLRNGLPQTKSLKAGKYDFDIDMETGTEARELSAQIEDIEQEITSLRAKLKKESQFNRKMELNIEIKRLEQKKNTLVGGDAL